MEETLRTPAVLFSKLVWVGGENAVLRRELRVILRNQRTFGVLALYVAVLGFIVAMQFPAGTVATVGTKPGSGIAGQELFHIFWLAQAMMVAVLLPAIAAGTLAQERERRTLEPLLLTPLTPGQIVWGKAVGVMLFALILLVATIPITSLCFLLNGVSPADLAGMYAVLLGLAAFVTGFGLYCSAHWQSPTQATFACYLLLPLALCVLVIFSGPGSLVAGLGVLGYLFHGVARLHRHFKTTKWALKLRIVYDLAFVLLAIGIVWFLLRVLSIGLNAFLLVFMTPYALFVAKLGLERTGEEIAKRPEPRRTKAQRINDFKSDWQNALTPTEIVYLPAPTGRYTYSPQTPPSDWSPYSEVAATAAVTPLVVPQPPIVVEEKPTYGVKAFLSDKWNPIFARDLRAGLLGKFSYLGRFSYGIVIASELLLLFQMFFFSTSLVSDSDSVGYFLGWVHFHLALLILGGAVLGTRAIAPEREQQTLPQLLTTPLSARTIILGKMQVVLLYTFYIFVMAAPMALMMGGLKLMPITSALGFLALEVAWGGLAAAWGIACSIMGVTVRRSLSLALGGVLVAFLLNILVHMALLTFVTDSSNLSGIDSLVPTYKLHFVGASGLHSWSAVFALLFDRYLLPFTSLDNVVRLGGSPGIKGPGPRLFFSLAAISSLAMILMLGAIQGFKRCARNE